MSYDIAVVIPPIAETDAAAWQSLDAMIEQAGAPPVPLQSLYDAVTLRYPCLSELSDEDSENGVWSSAPLWGDFGRHAAVLAIQFPHAEAVVPFVVETARSLGLTVLDWQAKLVHRPDGIKDLELSSEGNAVHRLPAYHQIIAAAEALTPDGGPGFLILERAGRDFLQVAGGNGAYACEWRMHNGNTPRFTHSALGLYNVASEQDVQIPTNGFYVTVKQNERLALSDVKVLLSAFAGDDDPPADYTYRDITERFQ
jgi:hypothetical protein